MKTEIEILRKLVKVQNELLEGYSSFGSSMPFCMGDVIKGYSEYVGKISSLNRKLKKAKASHDDQAPISN